jgi:hypothetical protein
MRAIGSSTACSGLRRFAATRCTELPQTVADPRAGVALAEATE